MSGRLCAAVLLIAACGASWPQPKGERSPHLAPAKNSEHPNESNRRQHPTEEALPVRIIQSPTDAAHADERERKADQDQRDNLQAQRRAAYAAEDQVRAAWSSIGLSAIAAIFLIWTFFETRRSANAAVRAANAAESAVAVAQDTAKRELRAYLTVDDGVIEFLQPGIPRVGVTIKNSGQTPAYDVKQWMNMWIDTYPLVMTLPTPPEDFVMGVNVMGPGATRINVSTHPQPIMKNPADYGLIGTPQGTIYIYGKVTYRDIFGVAQSTQYRLMYGGPEVTPGKLTACPAGNEAT